MLTHSWRHGGRHVAAGGTAHHTSHRRLTAAALAGVAATALAVSAAPADAVTGFRVTGASLGLSVRSGPGTGYAAVSHLADGAAIDIACQAKGTLVGVGLGGTPTDVWDRLSAPASGWISDYYTTTPGLNGAYSAGIPQCGAAAPVQPPVPAPVSAPAPAGIDCTKVLFIGLRGSDEPIGPQGMGDQSTVSGAPVDVTFDRLAALGVRMDRLSTVDQSLYPAVSVPALLLNYAKSTASVAGGTALAVGAVRTQISVCGAGAKVALAGYSQGAIAIDRAIGQLSATERAHVLAVVTYGDPYYNPRANGAVGPTNVSGVFGTQPAYPNGLSSRSATYCLANDPVCGGTSLTAIVSGAMMYAVPCMTASKTLCSHYQYPARSVPAAVAFLAARLK